MRRILVALGIGLAALGVATPAHAAQTVTVDGVEATRIVIAPPQSDLARTIRARLRTQIDNAADERARGQAEQLYYFYGARHFEPIWLTPSGNGALEFSATAQAIVPLFEKAHLQGLEPQDYLTPAIDRDAAGTNPGERAALEAAFSAAALRYARDAHTGRLDPASVSGTIDLPRKSVDETVLLESLSTSADPASVLMGYHPQNREFEALRARLAKHYSGEIEESVTIAPGAIVRPGGSDPRMPDLRTRLDVSAPSDLRSPSYYDDFLVSALKQFQTRQGLTVDGILGPNTVAALNGGSAASMGDIVANMERWRWMPADLGDTHVLVNVPQYGLEVSNAGRITFETDVIVGESEHQTPIFSDRIRHVVTNPYWNVPRSIVRNEIMPQLRADPGYIANQNMEVLYDGEPVNPWAVDWSRADPNNFRIRQRPGRANALGLVKFMFPNSHSVYLHDTNARNLFARANRALSHGCVRVDDPFAFAQALLEYESGFDVAALEGTLGSSERWFNMEREIPVHLAYFTLRVAPDGQLRAYSDIYGHNAATKARLGVE